MKPHVTLHMASSIDGRIVPSNWPEGPTAMLTDIYEVVHRQLKGDGWIVGRVTMAEFAKGEPMPAKAAASLPRQSWRAPGAGKGPFAIAIDQGGKLHLNVDKVNGDPLISILTEAVSDDHLAELQRDGISYIFAGGNELDMGLALEILRAEFGIERLLLEGGGGINGSFLSSGLIDEISLLICPVADGMAGPTVIDRTSGPKGSSLNLTAMDRLEGGVVHLRYDVVKA